MTERRVRCVVDTNVLISAALRSESVPDRVLRFVTEKGTLLASDDTLSELTSRLSRPKFARYLSEPARDAFLLRVFEAHERVAVTRRVSDSADPDDNAFLALALDGGAACIVTGDRRHLLPLHPWRGIPVLTPRAFAMGYGLL